MVSIVGIDSRDFRRNSLKRDGSTGYFESVIGVAVKVKDYDLFSIQYQTAMKLAFSEVGLETNYQFYCVHDLSEFDELKKIKILEVFAKEISLYVEKIHVFYTLFSMKRLDKVQVFGRYSKKHKLKLSNSTMTYEELRSKHILQCFPAICAWKLVEYFSPGTVQFHLDSYEGHICEAQEILENSKFIRYVYPSGDCANPVISTADLLLELLDKRLGIKNKYLVFDNIRPALPEFGENLLVKPIHNKHLPKITPLDKESINTLSSIKHPVFWVFKGDKLIDSATLKTSKPYRGLVDFAASAGGVVKLFDSNKDIEYWQKGDYGVYFNSLGKETIESYKKIGKEFKPFSLDTMIPKTKISSNIDGKNP